MANRVYITKDFLKLSKPGFNAMTAGNGSLLFTSDFMPLNLLMQGQVTVTAAWYTIAYPVTLTKLPLVSALVQDGANVWWHINRANQLDGTDAMVQMQVETGQVHFRHQTPSVKQVRYSVWIQ